MESRRSRTNRDYVAATLRAEILRGLHARGVRLRQEEIACRLGTSTTPVREAFRDLVGEGLIDLDAHRGAVVRGLTLADVRELYEMRIVLEPMLAASALAAMTAEHLEQAVGVHRRLCAERDPDAWASLNIRFHRTLTAPVSESRLTRTVDSLADAAEAYVALSMRLTPELMALNNGDHADLLDRYRRGDRARLQADTAAHLARTLRAIERDAETRAIAVARSDGSPASS